MKPIILPDDYNYIAAFLTLRCNLNCSYCINRYNDFVAPDEMSAQDWITGLSRIRTREDLPITLQGGEPTLHKGFYEIVEMLYGRSLDLLTNGMFDVGEFMNKVYDLTFNRNAKYASIRFSYHKNMNAVALAMKVWTLQNNGYEVGIWGLSNNDNIEMKKLCEGLNIDFREKEYLSDKTGTYKYPEAIIKQSRKRVVCKTTELLIGPSGYIFRCHADLYANRNSIAHILDKEVKLPGFMECDNFGYCNPCDIKTKFNRFQEYGHCSVIINE